MSPVGGERGAGVPLVLRFVLFVALLACAAPAVGLACWSGMPAAQHKLAVIGVALATIAAVATPWRNARRKLGAACVVALANSYLAYVVLRYDTMVVGGRAWLILLTSVPFAVAAILGSGVRAAAFAVTGWLVTAFASFLFASTQVLMAIYSFTPADVVADRERVLEDRRVELLVDGAAEGRGNPRAVLLEPDGAIDTGFQGGRDECDDGCTVHWPDRKVIHHAITALMRDPASGLVCGVGSLHDGIEDDHFFCARSDGSESASIQLPEYLGIAGAYDEARRRALVVHQHGSLTALTVAPLAVTQHLDIKLFNVDSAVPLWSAGRLLVRASDGHVGSVNLDDFSVNHRYLGVGSVGMGIGTSEALREVYVADMMEPVIHVLDPVTLDEKRRLSVVSGLRIITDLGGTGRIATAGYFDGMLYVLDAGSGAIVSRTFVGRLTRAIAYQPSANSALVGSRVGLMRVPL